MFFMQKMAAIIVVIPISLLMALSFFVLLSVDKVQTKRLKNFGYGVVVILWLATLVLILGGINRFVKGPDQGKNMMHKEMMMRRAPGMPGMPPEQMPVEAKQK